MESGAGQEQCKKENCIAIEVPKTPQEMEEEYDYSYGYEDDSAPDPKWEVSGSIQDKRKTE